MRVQRDDLMLRSKVSRRWLLIGCVRFLVEGLRMCKFVKVIKVFVFQKDTTNIISGGRLLGMNA